MSSRIRLMRQGARPQGCGQGLDRRAGVMLRDPAQSWRTLAEPPLCALRRFFRRQPGGTDLIDLHGPSASGPGAGNADLSVISRRARGIWAVGLSLDARLVPGAVARGMKAAGRAAQLGVTSLVW